MIKHCLECGKEFEVLGTEYNQNHAIYCSVDCGKKHRRKAKDEERLHKVICSECGTEFETTRANKSCCGPECVYKRQLRRSRENGKMYRVKYKEAKEQKKKTPKEEAWELAKSIVLLPEYGGISNGDLVNMFGTFSPDKIFKGFTVEEALAKIEAYEKKNEIKVGDEVVHGEGSFQTKFTVTFFESNKVEGFDKNGNAHSFCYPNPYIKKTGKHIDIESLLKEIGE